jgi:hypothetical protein
MVNEGAMDRAPAHGAEHLTTWGYPAAPVADFLTAVLTPFCLFFEDSRQHPRRCPPWPQSESDEKNLLFAGAETSAEKLARAMTLFQKANKNGLDLQAHLADLLDCIKEQKIKRLDELLPLIRAPTAAPRAKAA